MLPLFCTNWNRISLSYVSCMVCGFGQRTKDWCEQIASHGILRLDRKTSRIIYIYWSDAFFNIILLSVNEWGSLIVSFGYTNSILWGTSRSKRFLVMGWRMCMANHKQPNKEIPWLGIQIHSSSIASVRQKLHQLLDFLEEKKNSIEKWFITRRGLWFSIPRWGFSQQKKTQNATQVINLPPDYVDHTSVLKLIQNDIMYANGFLTVTLHSYILIKSERNLQYTVDFLWPVNGVLHSLSQN